MTLDNVLQMINEATGFQDREPFETEDEVVRFFSPEAQVALHGDLAITEAATLEFWAGVILGTGHHCTFPGQGFDEDDAPKKAGG